VCLQRAEPVRPEDDYESLASRLAALGGELLVEALDTRPPCREQSADGVSYAEKVSPDDRRLDPVLGAERLERRVRALTPHVGAYVELPRGSRLGVRRARVAREVASPEPGELSVLGERLLYGTADWPLELLEVHPAGGKPMEVAAWLRGHASQVGDRVGRDG
jgi:methionyl-tRNA formyltransferase